MRQNRFKYLTVPLLTVKQHPAKKAMAGTTMSAAHPSGALNGMPPAHRLVDMVARARPPGRRSGRPGSKGERAAAIRDGNSQPE